MCRHCLIVLIAGLGAGLCGCPAAPDADPKNVSFAQDVQPIFTADCAGCHSPGGFAQAAGITLDLTAGNAFDSLAEHSEADHADDAGGRAALVVPGDAESSFLFDKISSASPASGERMPLLGFPLSDSQIATIRDWIDAGAPNN
jgi:mono/diheme cytochrome c family protein